MTRKLIGALLLAAAIGGGTDAWANEGRAATVIDMGNGSVEFDVVLPSGQAYVEVFVRQNGIQNIATNIVHEVVDHGDGTSTYRHVAHGYCAGDLIEYRFYSYLPNSPGLFTPGPIENLWQSLSYGTPRFTGDDRAYALGPQTNVNGEPVDIEVYYASKMSRIQPVSVGWELIRANPSPFTTALLRNDATMLGIYVKPCESASWVNIANTPFAVFSPSEYSDPASGTYTYSAVFNAELPGTRVNPVYECGGYDITIPTLIGPQTLRTNTTVELAYVVEHKS